jgi:ribonuclease BN (tRNA processing enzyme)
VAPSRDLLLAEKLDWKLTDEGCRARLYRNQLALAEGADLVVYDTFFTPEQYADCKHWGHSTLADGIDACRESGARHLMMFHHNPDLHDDQVLQQPRPSESLGIHVAREGDTYRVLPGNVERCA